VNSQPNQTWISRPLVTSDWAQTRDGKADSIDIPVQVKYKFYNDDDATLTYFSFVSGVYEQIPEVFNGISYSYFHYQDDNGTVHVVLYSQPVNGGTPVKPVDPITLKLVLIPSKIIND